MSGLAKVLLQRFVAICGEKNALRPPADLTHYTDENRDLLKGKTPLVLKPATSEEVSAILKLANETGTAIVPQGGHTGHAGGAAPSEANDEIVVSMERMNAIREIDAAGNTMTVEAGVILRTIQETADRHDRLFPLSLGSEGSCQIGGNISTNAGGVAVLAYGNTRDMILGIEAVLPSGEIWSGLRKLKKDNTGYDLKDLFIGAEGTLGIVTAAVVRLFPKPKARQAAFAGVTSPDAALALFNSVQAMAGPALTAFELIPRLGIDFVLNNAEGHRDPLAEAHPWYALAEISSNRSEEDANDLMEAAMGAALEAGHADDVMIAHNEAQRQALWSIRETLPPMQKLEGGSIKHDISVAVHRIPEFLRRAEPLVLGVAPDARICAFGHMGDGNLHYNISQPVGADKDAFMALAGEINDKVFALVVEMDGSISAEHGIGRFKRDLLAATKPPAEMAMMRAIKRAFDPNGIMNPGKVV